MILDHVENIVFKTENPVLSNYQSLFALHLGLYNIAMRLRKRELERFNPKVKISEMHFSNPENLFFSCNFDWFSISLLSYVRLVALIDLMQKRNWSVKDLIPNKAELKKYCSQYADSVVPQVKRWRNKVGAHPAITDPYSDDNIATLQYSVMATVSYTSPYYCVGEMVYSQGNEDQYHVSDFDSWSISKVFDELTPRFWPHSPLPAFPVEGSE